MFALEYFATVKSAKAVVADEQLARQNKRRFVEFWLTRKGRWTSIFDLHKCTYEMYIANIWSVWQVLTVVADIRTWEEK